MKENIHRTLIYYDLFAYPLTAREIHAGLGVFSDYSTVANELQAMESANQVFKFEEFYSLQNEPRLVANRKVANEKAQTLLTTAHQKAKFIFRFPFIRGILISGSLSKNYADDKSDLDFFIITKPDRLWIARTVFVLVRKILVARKNYKNYCLNYFITEDRLALEERNLFTATELTTLIPVFGFNLYKNLMQSNWWVRDFLPNHKFYESGDEKIQSTWVKKISEKLLDLVGEPLDNYLMNLTLRIMKRRHQSKFTKEDFDLALKTKRYISKIHLGNNQKRILNLYNERLNELKVEISTI